MTVQFLDQPEPVTQGAARRALSGILATWSGRIGLVGTIAVLGVAFLGPFVAPSPTRLLELPFSPPGGGQLLGTDLLGRSVLDRVMHGGYRLIAITTLATLVSYALGALLGLLAGYRRGIVDSIIMRALDVLLSFPPVLLLLLLAASAGQGTPTIFIGAVLVNVPGAARVIRSAAQEVAVRPYVEAAIMRGEPTHAILRREILPNISTTVLADAGPRLSGTIILIAGLNYLGIGVDPPTPDWGAMIFENRSGITLQPWAVAAPALLIVLLVVFLNLIADAYAQTSGRSGLFKGSRK